MDNDGVIKKDMEYEGRDQYYLDVDRMMNEGMAGGSVNPKYDRPSVDQYHDILIPEPRPKEET